MNNIALKRSIVRIDHLCAWLAAVFLIGATVVYARPQSPSWMQLFNPLFYLTFLVHTLCSIYRFKFPPLKLNRKSIQLYSGYGILLTVILNIVFYEQATIAAIIFWANWFFVGLHVVLTFSAPRKRKARR